ncbi:MAG TPA: APC family permease [Kofleriaceae bacterium]|nr:APC family permease [Kofleriaceae bacterium]
MNREGQASGERIREVEARSAEFRKELGLRDLVLTQIVYVVGSGWVGTAALLGTAHVTFWLLAIALYYLPQAAVVIYLNRQMPLEGGLYQWARVGFGEFGGFLTAWNLWAYTVVIMATFAVVIATNLSYLAGPAAAALTATWWYTPLVSTATIAGLTVVSVLGLRVGKWLQSIGGAAHVLTFAALIVVPFIALGRGKLDSYQPLAASVPALSLLSLNIFGKMAMGALSGFEYVAILAGECRSPARTIGRSVVVAVPIIALMFILGTSSTLALVPAGTIDLISPIPQTLSIGFQGLGVASLIVPVLIVTLLLRQIGTVTLIFAGNTRLPMVAGWDGLLPRWFTRLHPRFRTPINSVVFVGVITLALSLAGQVGVGLQESFQLLENAAGILYAFTYLSLFAIPIVAARRLAVRPPLWLRVAALSGFAVTGLYAVLSIFPIIDVASWQTFSIKIIAVLVATQAIGVALFAAGHRRARRAAM